MNRRDFLLALPLIAAGARAAVAATPAAVAPAVPTVYETATGGVLDMEGGDLSLDRILEAVYRVRRNRMADGQRHQVIDTIVHEDDLPALNAAFRGHLEVKYGAYACWTECIPDSGWPRHSIVDLPEIGCKVAIFSGPSLDPLLPEVSPIAHKSTLWLPDWSDIYPFRKGSLIDHPERHLTIRNWRQIVL